MNQKPQLPTFSSKPTINKFDPNKLTVPTRADVQSALTPIEDFSGVSKVITIASIQLKKKPIFPQVKRNRKCSIVREEDDDEEELSDGVAHSDSSSTFSRRGSKSEGRLNLLMQKVVLKTDDEGKMFKNGVCPLSLTCKDDTKIITQTTKSLDEIEIIDNPVAKNVATAKPRNLPTIRRNKLIQIRTPSCSSSEASDDDTKARKKKTGNMNDTPSRFHYRDSHDDSSDSQEQPNNFANSSARIPKRQQQQQNTQQSSSGNEKQQQQQQNSNSKEKSNTRNKKHENLRQMRSRARRHTNSRHKESQSLDRICESHEYGAGNEFNHSVSNNNGNKRNSISGTCATIDVDEINPKFKSAQSDTNITNLLNSAIIEDELLYGGCEHDDEDEGKAKAIIGTHTTKYSRAFKKITQLKRYFHVVNFS